MKDETLASSRKAFPVIPGTLGHLAPGPIVRTLEHHDISQPENVPSVNLTGAKEGSS